MKKLSLFFLLFLMGAGNPLFAQDTLPRFSLIKAGANKVIIGWINPFENVKQISIQRSFDSLTGYKSILTVADPSTKQNGYLDARAVNDHMFYRIYIMLEGGVFLFSDAKKPMTDTTHRAPIVMDSSKGPVDQKNVNTEPVPDSATRVTPLVIRINGFPGTDSVTVPNPVTLKKRPDSFVPSIYVYTSRDGYVCVKLPETEKPKKYSIKFFEADESFLFELKDIREKEFKIDKTNFYHAGWFRFELYEEGKLMEKHKFYLEKDF